LNGTANGAGDALGKAEPVTASAVPHAFLASRGMNISPDGKILAYLIEFVPEGVGTGHPRIALLDLTTLDSPRLVEVNPHIAAGPQFTADGKALSYPISDNGVDDIWVQPLDGSAGRQITKFDSEQILKSLVAGWQESRHSPRPHRLRRHPPERIQTLDCCVAQLRSRSAALTDN
jgi:hypothetical protein